MNRQVEDDPLVTVLGDLHDPIAVLHIELAPQPNGQAPRVGRQVVPSDTAKVVPGWDEHRHLRTAIGDPADEHFDKRGWWCNQRHDDRPGDKSSDKTQLT